MRTPAQARTQPPRQPAKSADALNTAISDLWQAAAIHSKDAFNQQIVPIYTRLLDALKAQNEAVAEQQLLDLLKQTTRACHHRWTLRLPLRRPGSDYRKYEIIYTEALITALAIDCLKQAHNDPPDQLAEALLPQDTLTKLKDDPIVWQDWLGYFEQAEEGGLYAVSIQQRTEPTTTLRTPKKTQAIDTLKTPKRTKTTPKPPPGSGRAMLEAIHTALNNGTLSYNQPGDAVQVDRAGRTFLEHPQILKWCNDQLKLNEDLKTLKSRFSRLKVLSRSAQGKQLWYGKHHEKDRRHIGYVIEDPAGLWPGNAPTGHFRIEIPTPKKQG